LENAFRGEIKPKEENVTSKNRYRKDAYTDYLMHQLNMFAAK
jgi:hypothetical protein